MKDVGQMLKEIEDIEEQELKSFGQTQYNEKGLEEKKSKLHASIHRVARYYVCHIILDIGSLDPFCHCSNKRTPKKHKS